MSIKRKKLNIAFIGSKGLPPTYGGSEQVVKETATRLRRFGHKITIFCTNPPASKYKGIYLKKVFQVNIPAIDRILREIFPIFTKTIKNSHIVHIHGPGGISSIILRLMGKKIVVQTDGMEWKRQSYNYIIRMFVYVEYFITVKIANIVYHDAKFIGEFFKRSWKRTTTYLIYGPKESIGENYDISLLGLKKNDYYLFIGRIVPEKGIEELIKAFIKSRSKKKLVLLGKDPFGGNYINRLKAISNENIIFLGTLFGEKFETICKQAFANIRPSNQESEGTNPVTIEMMHWGSCIIASKVRQNTEILENAALYFNPGNIEELCDILKKLEKYPGITEKYRKRALKLSKEHTWEKIIKKIESDYQKLMI